MMLRKTSLILLASSLLLGCQFEAEHREKPPLVVELLEVTAPISSQFRIFNGVVEPADLTPLSFRVEGELSQIVVKEGDRVKQGDVLATVNSDKFKQNLDNAQVRYELAARQLERGQDLYQREMVSSAELDELSATSKLAKAQRDTAKTFVRYSRLKAPFDGVISSVDKKKHENISPGEVVLTLYKEDQLHVKINVSDSILAMMDPTGRNRNYQPLVSFAGNEKRVAMHYLEHTSELHPQSQSYEFWLHREQITPEILPGTSATVYVDMVSAGMGNLHGHLIPMTAIYSGESNNDFYVWKLENNLAQRYPITVDQITGLGAVVSKGIEQGDTIINSNLRKLRAGMEIKGAAL
ncbi:efflux RND transporter periplasmic adaptor subunit [Vibrio sp. 404]|uniref:Efflux RND transporter periplasmic adaptor subunit n=1 Tax=Vibrio marinisediminis TaxID=2758441 RepID=A0A7W2FUC7_9VIBR|nr:efflux RND transporter periplasmic adaptor subunit [Vibrio marinisediminis]MBA5764401.1 efflux RND transporter periplasmic adaptor subunit [Vibrio marinisediminis]